MITRPSVYLAGPDVFRLDAAEHFALLIAICDTLGLKALTPFDASGMASPAPQAIYAGNMERIRSAQGIAANLAPFRGTEPDSGTVFEVGVAIALGLPVVAYNVPLGSYAERVRALVSLTPDADGIPLDADGHQVEDFGLQLNLMLACSVTIVETPEQALQALARLLQP